MTIYGIQSVPLHMIDANPWQTRRPEREDTGHIQSLADDILLNGLLQIPTGRRVREKNRVQLAFGHSRLSAYRLLLSEGHSEYAEFPVNLVPDLSDEQMAIIAFAENEKRRDLDPIERAEAIRKMLLGFTWSQQDIAERLKIDRSSVANALRMLSLPGDVQRSIADGMLPVRSAMALLPFYELTPLEIGTLQREKPDYSDFLALARSGQVTSDTIRAKVGEWMDLLHPKPLELPLVEETPAGEAEQEEEPVPLAQTIDEVQTWEPEEPVEAAAESDDMPEDEEPGDDEEEEQPNPSPSLNGREDEPKPAQVETRPDSSRTAPKAQPAPAAQPVPAATPSKDRVVTIRWFEAGGVGIGVQHPGEIIPRFTFRQSLAAADVPELLEGMGIE